MTETAHGEPAGTARIGVIGVGPVGRSIARTLVEHGHEVAVYDISPDAVARAVADGARAAPNARVMSEGRDVVFTALPTSKETHSALLDPVHGLLEVMSPAAALVDVTTSAPAATIELSRRCAAAGVDYLESPVSGRPPHFTMFVGGDRRVIERAMPLLATLSNNVVHLGDVGAGSRAKILHQLMAFGNFALACEAFAIATRAGLPLGPFAQALRHSRASSAMLPLFESTVLERDFEDRGGSLAQIAKDMRLVRGVTAELGVASALAAAVTEAYIEAERSGMGHESAAAVAKAIETRIGATSPPSPLQEDP